MCLVVGMMGCADEGRDGLSSLSDRAEGLFCGAESCAVSFAVTGEVLGATVLKDRRANAVIQAVMVMRVREMLIVAFDTYILSPSRLSDCEFIEFAHQLL